MKKLLFLFAAILLLLGGKIFAQKTFEPLLTENTLLFVHVDFNKVELDTLKVEMKKIGEDLLKGLHFDAKSAKATLKEFDAELEKFDAKIRPVFETVTQKLGIKELAIIADFKLLEANISPVLVAPWKGKTDADLQTLFALLPDEEVSSAYHSIGDFLIVSPSPYSPERKAILDDWVHSAVSVKDTPIQQAMQTLGNDEIKFAVALPESLKAKLLASPLLNASVPPPLNNLLLYAARKVEWAAASISLADLAKGKILKEDKTLFTIKTAKDSDAAQLRVMLESSIDLGLSAAQFAMQQTPDEKVPPLFKTPLFFEFSKGFLRTLLPDVEEDKLVFRIKGEHIQTLTAIQAASIGFALTLPAIQGARESARRMQCANHEKQILLAFHNYHEVNRALPPLYTVDANGKPLHSWRVLILPFIEQYDLYKKIRLDEPWDSEHNKQFHNVEIPVFRCPNNPNAEKGKQCCYSAIAGEGLIPAKKAGETKGHSFADFTDGMSNTLAVVEVKEPFCWMNPTADITLDELLKGINADGRVGSFHPTGINGALLDGSAHFMPNTTPKATLKALGDIDDGEVVR